MFSFLSQSNVNLLLIDAVEVMHLRWQGGELFQIDQYNHSAADLVRFESFLKQDDKTPFVIVADVIEEDFRTETIVHVSGGDRKALIARKLQTLFRTSPFRTARVIGREKVGRKDDRILFTGLTKPETLEPWLERILAQKTPIKAVTSAAYIMEQFAQSHSLSGIAHLLVVNHELGSGLRQTYLQNGRVIFGRLTPTGVSRSENFAELLLEQCNQTRKYLERIKQLPYDAPLEVYVYTPEAYTEEIEANQELLHFHYNSIETLPLTRKINLENGQAGAIAYSLVWGLRKRGIANVYASQNTLRYLQIFRIRRLLSGLSALVLIGAALSAGPELFNLASKLEEEANLNLRIAPLNAEYAKLTERFPETPIPSNKMAIIVETHDRISAQTVTPVEVLGLVSEGLELSPNLALRKLEWGFDVVTDTDEEMGYGLYPAATETHTSEQAFVDGRAQMLITVSGIVRSESSFRDATAQVMRFVDTLDQYAGYEVTPVHMPINVGSDIEVSTTVDGSEASGEFTVEIRKVVTQ